MSNLTVTKAFSDIADAIRSKTGETSDLTPSQMVTAIGTIPSGLSDGYAHNSIYRGENLGTSVTSSQFEKIADGSFDDLYIGDYWEIGGNNYRIAAFDYFLSYGDSECTTHHVILVPDYIMYIAKMEDTDITTNGYKGSKMRTTYLDDAKTTINNAFGSSHILTYRDYLTSASTNGFPSARVWDDATVELMSERMAYGCPVFAATTPEFSSATTINKDPANNREMPHSQFPLFALDRSKIIGYNIGNHLVRGSYWLRDIASTTSFACVYDHGCADRRNASSNTFGVRPCFGIVG